MNTISKKRTTTYPGIASLRGKGVFFSFEIISEIESALEDILSPSATATILCMIAKKAGASSCRKILRMTETKRETLKYLSNSKSNEKWGTMSFQNIDFVKNSGEITVVDSFESIARKTTWPCCHIFRGFLEGFLSELFGKTIEITEEKCAGKGDEHCRFVFQKR